MEAPLHKISRREITRRETIGLSWSNEQSRGLKNKQFKII